MARPWIQIASVPTEEGLLELRRRGERDFLIVVGGRVLMTSTARRSEEALATIACALVADRRAPRLLIGGLGMGFTVRAALDALPQGAKVVVAELTPAVVDWCRGELAPLTDDALADPRVQVELGDVAGFIAAAGGRPYDAILLDLYEGPHAATQDRSDPFYGAGALARTRDALVPGGIFAVWSEEPDRPFQDRLARAGFEVTLRREGRGGRTHVIYIARRRMP